MIRVFLVVVAVLLLANQGILGQTETTLQSVIDRSRQQCVRIYVPEKQAWGSGFFLDDRFVVTCFHIVGGIDSSGTEAQIRAADKITVICSNGQEIDAECRSIPSRLDMTPVLYDFAILWLKGEPDSPVTPAKFRTALTAPAVGTHVLFTALSLDIPTLMTHRGYISGEAGDGSILCVQAPISAGMSGAALYTVDGTIVGIMNARESRLPQKLVEIARRLYALKPSIEPGPHALMLDLVESMGLYSTQGVAYATTARRLVDYLERHPRNEP
jgi:hypothetical protein